MASTTTGRRAAASRSDDRDREDSGQARALAGPDETVALADPYPRGPRAAAGSLCPDSDVRATGSAPLAWAWDQFATPSKRRRHHCAAHRRNEASDQDGTETSASSTRGIGGVDLGVREQVRNQNRAAEDPGRRARRRWVAGPQLPLAQGDHEVPDRQCQHQQDPRGRLAPRSPQPGKVAHSDILADDRSVSLVLRYRCRPPATPQHLDLRERRSVEIHDRDVALGDQSRDWGRAAAPPSEGLSPSHPPSDCRPASGRVAS